MAYIGNIIDSSKVRFAEMKATSLDKSAVQTIYLSGGEAGVNNSPVDAFGVSLEKIILDCNTPDFDIIDMGTIVAAVGIVDFGYI
jgi:hypothetical protein